jgi:hypothetical protein
MTTQRLFAEDNVVATGASTTFLLRVMQTS